MSWKTYKHLERVATREVRWLNAPAAGSFEFRVVGPVNGKDRPGFLLEDGRKVFPRFYFPSCDDSIRGLCSAKAILMHSIDFPFVFHGALNKRRDGDFDHEICGPTTRPQPFNPHVILD